MPLILQLKVLSWTLVNFGSLQIWHMVIFFWVDEAKKIYMSHKGEKTNKTTLWAESIRDDFKYFREHNISNQHFEDIEKMLFSE